MTTEKQVVEESAEQAAEEIELRWCKACLPDHTQHDHEGHGTCCVCGATSPHTVVITHVKGSWATTEEYVTRLRDEAIAGRQAKQAASE